MIGQTRVTFAVLAWAGALVVAAPPKLPPVPDALLPLKARVGGHYSTKMVTLSFTALDPPTEAQWNAISSVPVKAIAASGRGINDDAMDRLSKLPLDALLLEHAPVTDASAVKFVNADREV
jgi:hypothetical protein